MQNRALREAEIEIELALQRYCDLYDHLPIGYLTLTRSGRITQSNLTAAGWLRRDRTNLVGSYLHSFLDAFDAGRFAAHLEACLDSGSEQALGATLRLDSGLLMTVQLTSRPAQSSDDGEPQVNTALTNVSKVRQAHAIVSDIEAEQGEASQSITQFLRAPLVTINKSARALLQEHGLEQDEGVKNIIERMECAAVRMENTLQDLLDYCCLGQEKVALDPVNLDELAQHVIMEHRDIIQRRGAEIIVERPLPCVRGARLLLGQVLANVVTSALKPTKPDTKPRLRIHASQHDHEVVLKVLDEGRSDDALPEQEKFWLFERIHEKGRYGGAGVGLAIIRRAIERMNGRVWVDSRPEKGMCFNIGLPIV
jgi:light-regulated signal transduction histidine kinase (bacteriophytochrome)